MKTIAYSTVSAILVGLLVLGGVNLTDDDVYYCESRGIIMSCDRLSSTAKTCYNSEIGNKRCTEGWQEIEKEIITNSVFNSKQYLCNSKECVPI